MQVKHKRKDGKIAVTLSYSNGVKLNKILTREEFERTKREIAERNQ